ncbi:hypothetical protein [Halovenus marina]|uniref:hypothetical protein n=1 Tax=Halovenus marina TaxID=3396621 RepID=UPI003F54532C
MPEYETRVRSIEPEYSPLIAMEAGRDVENGREVKLQRVAVEVQVRWSDERETISVSYAVKHDDDLVKQHSVGAAFGETESLTVDRMLHAMVASERAMYGWLADIDLLYDLETLDDQLDEMIAASTDVAVHSHLEVQDA